MEVIIVISSLCLLELFGMFVEVLYFKRSFVDDLERYV